MSVIILLLIASISIAALFLAGFVWSVRDRQYEDEYSPPVRILFEDPINTTDHDNNNTPKPENITHAS